MEVGNKTACGFKSGISRTTRRPVCSACLRQLQAVNGVSPISAVEIHRSVALSKTASVYWIGLHASGLIPAIALLIAGSMRAVTERAGPALAAVPVSGIRGLQ